MFWFILYHWTCDQWIINPLLMPWFLMEINSAQAKEDLLLSLDKQSTCTSNSWQKNLVTQNIRSILTTALCCFRNFIVFKNVNLSLSKVYMDLKECDFWILIPMVFHFSYPSFPSKMGEALALPSLLSRLCLLNSQRRKEWDESRV